MAAAGGRVHRQRSGRPLDPAAVDLASRAHLQRGRVAGLDGAGRDRNVAGSRGAGPAGGRAAGGIRASGPCGRRQPRAAVHAHARVGQPRRHGARDRDAVGGRTTDRAVGQGASTAGTPAPRAVEDRPPDGPWKPQAPVRGARCRLCGPARATTAARVPVHRPQRLQAGQRLLWPPRRRRRPPEGRGPSGEVAAP